MMTNEETAREELCALQCQQGAQQQQIEDEQSDEAVMLIALGMVLGLTDGTK